MIKKINFAGICILLILACQSIKTPHMTAGQGAQKESEFKIPEEYKKVISQIESENYNQAIENLFKIIEANPSFYMAYRELVKCYDLTGRLPEGIRMLGQRAEKYPANSYVVWAIGLAEAGRKNHKAAIEKYKQVISMNPGFYKVYGNLVNSQVMRGESYLDIDRFFTELKEQNPENHTADFGLALSYYYQHNWEKALSAILSFQEKHLRIGEVYTYLGTIQTNMQKYEAAMDSYQKALKISKTSSNLYGELIVYRQMGQHYYLSGDYHESVENYKKSLALVKKIKAFEVESQILLTMAYSYFYLSEYDNSLEVLSRALEIAESRNNKNNMANIFSSMGLAYWQKSELQKALNYYNRGLELASELVLKQPENINKKIDIAAILNNMGALYNEFSDYAAAAEYYNRALDIYKDIEDESYQATSLYNLGIVYANMEKDSMAMDFAKKSLAICEKVNEKYGIGHNYFLMGTLYQKQEDYEQANHYYSMALEYKKAIDDKQSVASILSSMGEILKEQDAFDSALDLYNEALKINKQLGNRTEEAVLSGKIGALYYRQKAFIKALPYMEESIGLTNNIRGGLIDEEHRTGYIEDYMLLYNQMINLLFDMHLKNPGHNYNTLSFDYAQQGKGRVLLELLEEKRINIDKRIFFPLTEKMEVCSKEYSGVYSELQRELSKPENLLDTEKKAGLENRLLKLKENFEDLKTQIRRDNPFYGEIKYPEPITVTEIQENITDSSTLFIEYQVSENEILAWGITRNSFKSFRFPFEKERLFKEINLLRTAMELSDSNSFGKVAYNLYQKILEPVLTSLPGKKELIIVPHDQLNYLPFELLLTSPIRPEGTESFGEASYLLKDYRIQYTPSATVLYNILKNSKQKPRWKDNNLLAMGDPLFSTEEILRESAGIKRALADDNRDQFNRLIYSGEEVRKIGNLFEQADVYFQENALEEKIKPPHDTRKYTHLHLATHCVIDELNSQYSSLILTRDDDPKEDGLLQVREIFNLELNAELVVLSACNTGLGRLTASEGFIGFTRAWLYAGTKTLIVTLWEVNDEATEHFMVEFYRNLKGGLSKSDALAETKKWMQRKAGYENPYFWAGYVLIGDPGE